MAWLVLPVTADKQSVGFSVTLWLREEKQNVGVVRVAGDCK